MKTFLVFAVAIPLLVSCGNQTGKAGQNGAPGLNGLDGEAGIAGEKGDKGDKGDDGAVGAQGIQGTPGVAGVTSIKFCPNLVDVYGQAYAEYGMCINNKLYAVYWSGHQAFMTELSNGNYRTTTPYGNCNFTVSANCGVTQY